MSKYHGPPSRVEMYRKHIKGQGIGKYFVQESRFLHSFFTMVEKYVPGRSRLLEFEFGPGTMGVYLSRSGYKVTTVDPDPEVTELARETCARLDGNVEYRLEDLFEIDKVFGPDSFDAVVSDVTLEHFSDEDIVDALKKQLVVAKLNIFAVHCSNILPQFHAGLDGGERLLKPRRWRDLIKKAGGQVIDTFGYGFAYTQIGLWGWHAMVIAEELLWRKLAPYAANTGFVVVRDTLEMAQSYFA
jgi:2-polyprenyl-3-methyl-5-hydroxy-6-metoxy-1,4-benzoquinol methylase